MKRIAEQENNHSTPEINGSGDGPQGLAGNAQILKEPGNAAFKKCNLSVAIYFKVFNDHICNFNMMMLICYCTFILSSVSFVSTMIFKYCFQPLMKKCYL